MGSKKAKYKLEGEAAQRRQYFYRSEDMNAMEAACIAAYSDDEAIHIADDRCFQQDLYCVKVWRWSKKGRQKKEVVVFEKSAKEQAAEESV